MPRSFATLPLKRCVLINPETLPEDYDPATEIEYVDIGNVEQTRGIISTEKLSFGDAPSRARRLVRNGDTIISTVRTYLKAVAPIEDPPENMVVSTGFAVLSPGPDVHPKFLAWLAQSDGFVQRVEAHSVGVSYPAISPSVLGSLSVYLPAVGDQRRTADFLDRETARIDELIAKKERLSELLRERYLSLVEAALAPLRTSLALQPVPLGRFVVSMCDGPFGSDMKSSDYSDSGVRLIRLQNIRRGYFDDSDRAFISEEHFRNLPGHDVRPGDLLVAGLGDPNNPVGRACLLPPNVNVAMVKADCFRIRLNQRKLTHEFACCFLNSASARREIGVQLRGATRERINLTGAAKVCVPVPSLERQAKIVNLASSGWRQMQSMVTALQKTVERLQEYRTALISAAVTGQLDVGSYRKEPEAVLEAT